MKGVIVCCLGELVKSKFGPGIWVDTLVASGMDPKASILVSDNVEDAMVLKVINNLCERVGITLEQAADAFGDFWVNVYAPEIYKAYFLGMKSAKDFILKMDQVHEMTTRNIPGARPPRFTYAWENDKSLIMTYSSHRGLIAILVGLLKGVGRYFHETLKITKLSETKVRIEFLD